MDIYSYTAKDGEVVTGTLEQIGETIIDWHGDRATTDNPEPWLTRDDEGDDTPRTFTVDEWIDWTSRAEDRPIPHVKNALEAK